MAHHASPDGKAPEAGRRVALATVALVVAVALAVAFAPGVAAADDTLERNGSDLVVNVSDVDGPGTVTVEVTDPSDSGIVYRKPVNGTDTVSFDVTSPTEGGVNGIDLREATVTVSVDPTDENATVTRLTNGTSVSLHTVAFASDRPVWSDTAGEGDDATSTLYVPLNASNTVGLPTGDATVSIDLDENGTADLNGTVRGNGTQLTVDRGSLIGASGDSRTRLDLQVVASDDPVSGELVVQPELRSVRDGLALWHPLLASSESDQTYSVDASPVDGDARYTATGVESTDGYLPLPGLPPGNAAVRALSTDGTVLVDRTADNPVSYAGPSEITATLTDDGNLQFPRSLAGLAVDGAIVGSGDNSDYVDIAGSIDSAGQLAVGDTEITGAESMLLSTAAGDVSVTIGSATGDGGSGAGALGGISGIIPALAVFFVPLLVGALPGLVVGYRNQAETELVDTAILGVLGFALAALAVVVLFILFGADFVSTDLLTILGYLGIVFGTVLTAAGHRFLTSSGGVAAASGPFAAKVTVTDGSDLFRGDVSVHYREPDGHDRYDPVTVRGGRDTVQLPGTGTWEVYARHGSAQSSVKTVDANDPAARLTIPVEASLTVVDATDGEPIADATINSTDGVSNTTDRAGAVTLDPPADATDVDVEVSHDRYVTATTNIQFRQNANHTVELDRRTGQLRGSVRVDGAPVGGVPLRIVPDDEFLSDRFDVEDVTTDADGRLTPRDVPVGRYRIEAALGTRDGAYEATETTVSVTESGTARAEIDARFTWRLDDAHRTRIDHLRRDVQSLSDGGGRDGTIPRYYAFVVESMLDTAESVPEAGHEFVDRDVDPSEAVDGILAAADRTTDVISEAMTTKRNVDLFAACADMPDPDVRWRGSFELAELLDRLESDSGANRREVKQRYESVDSLIEDRRGDLSEIAPARAMHQRAWELTREAGRGPKAVATGYTSLLLLDAVEELFEHDALRERLTRTVF
jgi:hypothetical protein